VRQGRPHLGSLSVGRTGGPVESESNVGRVTRVFELDSGGGPCCLVSWVPWHHPTQCRRLCGGRIYYSKRLRHRAAFGYQERAIRVIHFPTLHASFPGLHCLSRDRLVSAALYFRDCSERVDPRGERKPVFLVASRGPRKLDSRIGANRLVAAIAACLLTAGMEYQLGISALFGSAAGALVAWALRASRVHCPGGRQSHDARTAGCLET
jgi:hypothetical protein